MAFPPALKNELLEACHLLGQKNLAAGYDGNLSLKFDHQILITGTQTYKSLASEKDLSLMDLNGTLLEGKKPSSEALLHLAIYRTLPETKAVIHAHPVKATALTLAQIPLIPCLTAEAYLLLGLVPTAPYSPPGSQNLADSVVPFLQNRSLVLMARHGAVAYGDGLLFCLDQLEKAEALAAKIFLLQSSGVSLESHVFTPDQRSELDQLRLKMQLEPPLCRCEKTLCPLLSSWKKNHAEK